MKVFLRVAVLCCAVWLFQGCRAERGLSFVQLTDPHLFDANTMNDRALSDCIGEINRRVEKGAAFDFVVVTGDLGIEQLVKNKIEQGPKKFAGLIAPCRVKKWLFVPGNNDLMDEDPKNLPDYSNFIADLKNEKNKNFEIVDLTPNDDPNSGVYRAGDYVFIGFNNASFKSNDNGDNAKLWGALDRQAVAKVRERVDREADKSVYIFYHIPEVDDPYYVLDPDADSEGWFIKRGVKDKPYKYSSWAVIDDVRKDWDDVVAKNQVKGLFAGHFHDYHHDTYRDFRWVKTSYPAGTRTKLHVCPPLAEKRQRGASEQARGFQIVTLDDAGKPAVEIIWYNEGSGFTPDQASHRDAPRKPAGPAGPGLKTWVALFLLWCAVAVVIWKKCAEHV